MTGQQIPMRAFCVDAWVCRVRDGACEFLLIRRASAYLTGTWQMVSGKLEPGEAAWEAALREVREETSIVPDRCYSADRVHSFYDPGENAILLVPVFVAFVDGDVDVRLSPEHDAWAWCSASDARGLLVFDQQVEMLDLIQRRFVDAEPPEVLRIEVPR